MGDSVGSSTGTPGNAGRELSRRRFLKLGGVVAAASASAPLLSACGGGSGSVAGSEITVAAVNNPQMEDMEGLAENFTRETDISVRFQFLPENELRQRVTQDVSLDAGNFDVVMISTYETPIWANNGWIEAMNPYFDQLSEEERNSYDLEDVFDAWRTSLSFEDQLYSIPFYGESSQLFYRRDLFEEAGLEMPERPTWDEVTDFAGELHDPDGGVSGIALRGLPGWGANMAPFATFINTYGGRWYDMDWQPQLDTEEFRNAVRAYTTLARDYGQSGITSDNFPECLTLFSSGKAAMWYDATVAGGLISDPETSEVADRTGFAFAPTAATPNGSHWQYAWSLGIEAASRNKDAAFEFIRWATNKDYINLVGEELGWERVPPGTRRSTYEDTPYGENDWTATELESIETADPENPTEEPVPYTGIQYIVIPEFPQLGDAVSRSLASVIAGDMSVDEMAQRSNKEALEVARQGEYLKS